MLFSRPSSPIFGIKLIKKWDAAIIPTVFSFQCKMNIYAAYGSSKDINVYQSAGIPLSKMYIVKPKNPKRKHQVSSSVRLPGRISSVLFVFGCFTIFRAFRVNCHQYFAVQLLTPICCTSTNHFCSENLIFYDIERYNVRFYSRSFCVLAWWGFYDWLRDIWHSFDNVETTHEATGELHAQSAAPHI